MSRVDMERQERRTKNLLSEPSEEAWPVESLILDFYTVKE